MIDLEPATSTLSALVEHVRDDQLSAPTPCAGISLGDLLDHVDGLSRAFTAAATKTPIDGAPSAVAEMTRDQLTPEQKARSGPGFLHGRSWAFCQSVVTEGPYAGAFGWDGGLGTSWLVDPRRELTVIVLTQRLFETPQPPQVHRDLQAAALAPLG